MGANYAFGSASEQALALALETHQVVIAGGNELERRLFFCGGGRFHLGRCTPSRRAHFESVGDGVVRLTKRRVFDASVTITRRVRAGWVGALWVQLRGFLKRALQDVLKLRKPRLDWSSNPGIRACLSHVTNRSDN